MVPANNLGGGHASRQASQPITDKITSSRVVTRTTSVAVPHQPSRRGVGNLLLKTAGRLADVMPASKHHNGSHPTVASAARALLKHFDHPVWDDLFTYDASRGCCIQQMPRQEVRTV